LLDAIRLAAASRQSQRVEFVERLTTAGRSIHNPYRSEEGPPVPGPRAHLAEFRDLTALRRVEVMRADFAPCKPRMRTPASIVVRFIETLQGSARDDVQARQRFLGIMKAQANRMAR